MRRKSINTLSALIFRALLLCVLALSLGCASTGDKYAEDLDASAAAPVEAPPEDNLVLENSSMNGPGNGSGNTPGDPLEKFNRAMFKFNDFLDETVLKPVAKGYTKVVPKTARKGISNFFSNLLEPLVIVNDLLQGKFAQMASDISRFFFNTVVGVGGFIDVATHLDMPKHDEDFGQTLGVWGVGPGPFVVWPFIGPRNLRDTVGWAADQYAYPVNYVESDNTRWGLRILDVVDTRSRYLGSKEILEQAAADDPYIFVREAYRQRRENLVYDGNPPVEDDFLFEDEPPAPQAPTQQVPTQQAPTQQAPAQ